MVEKGRLGNDSDNCPTLTQTVMTQTVMTQTVLTQTARAASRAGNVRPLAAAERNASSST